MPTDFEFSFPIGKVFFVEKPKVERVIFNGPATILFWEDGEKTVVKLREGDGYDAEKGVMAAMLKRLYRNYQDVLREALEGEDE